MAELSTAIRALRRTPGFTLAAVATLAIAAGAVNAILAVVSKVLLEPLPVRNQEEIVIAWKRDAASGFEHWPFTYPAVRAFEKQLTTVTEVATVDYNGAYSLSLVEGDQGVQIMTGIISGNLMRVLGVEPVLGRAITPDDDVVGAPRVAVISEVFWRNRYGAAQDILQRTFQMYGENYQIVGVVRGGFGLPAGTVMWIAQKPFQPDIVDSESYVLADLVVRLKPGATLEQFHVELENVRTRTPSETIEAYKAHQVVVTPLRDLVIEEARPTLLILTGGVVLLLVVAAANIGGLFLVRSGSRVHEVAIRSAIGGGTVRSLRAMTTEFALVVGAGVVLGVPLAWALLRLLGPMLPPELPVEGGIALTPWMVLAASAGCALAGLLGGAAPVIALARADLVAALRSGGRAAAKGWGMHPIRRVMVAGQIALAVTLVAGAGLLVRTLERMHRIDHGFRPEGVLLVDLADSRRYDTTLATRRAEVDRIIAELEEVPGVTAVSAVLSPPFVGNAGFYVKYVPVGMSAEDATKLPYANTDVVHPRAAGALGLQLLRGRFIEPSDREGAPMVVVVNETFARMHWPGGDPIDKRLRIDGDTASGVIVIGVVADTRYNELLRGVPMAYLAYRQMIWIPSNFIVRAGSDAAALALVPQLRQAVREAEPAVAIRRAVPLNDLLDQPLARPRLTAVLVSGFALIVLVLAAIGIYSVMASFVVQRTREIGVRMALGATGPMVHRLVFGQGMLLALIGVATGLALAAASSRVLKGMLYEVTPADPVTFGVVSVTLIAVAALAVLVPSIRAARLEPVEALRAD